MADTQRLLRRRSSEGTVSHKDLVQALDNVGDAILIVSRDRRLLYCNSSGDEFLSHEWPLQARRGRLVSASSNVEGYLGRAIDAACAEVRPSMQSLLLSDKMHAPLMLMVRCLEPGGSNVLLLAPSPRVSESRWVHPLRECFGLTPSEAMVAAAVAEGKSIAAIAAERQVAIGTIRTQVKTVAGKLGCTRQAQIGAIVRSIPYAALRH